MPHLRLFTLGFCFSFIVLLALPSCQTQVVSREMKDFDKYSWSGDSLLTFTFNIQDTSARYHVFYLVRHSVDYSFYNLYIKHSLKYSSGDTLKTDLHEMILMDPKTGIPYGNGLNDFYDLKIFAYKSLKFPAAGVYSMHCAQYMRQDPLKDIASFGISVEREIP